MTDNKDNQVTPVEEKYPLGYSEESTETPAGFGEVRSAATSQSSGTELPNFFHPMVVSRSGAGLPADFQGEWSWGAFFFGPIYFAVRKQYRFAVFQLLVAWVIAPLLSTVLPFMTLLSLAVAILGAYFGRRLTFIASDPGSFPTNQSLKDADKPWVIAGIIVFVLSIIAAVLLISFFAALIGLTAIAHS